MVLEFKKSKIAYFVMLIITSALILLLFIPHITVIDGVKQYAPLIPGGFTIQNPVTRWIGIILGLVLAQMVSSAVAASLGNREFQKLAYVLLHSCDSARFFERAEPLYKKGSRQAAIIKYVLLGKGMVAEGKFEKVPELTQKAEEEANVDWLSHDMRISLCGAYANLCIASVEMGDNQTAIKTYSKLKATAEATVGNKNAYEAAQKISHSTREYVALFAKSGFNDTKLIESIIEDADTEYDRILYHYALARMQEELGNHEAAQSSYRYVVENGNTFACVTAAIQQLQ